MSAEKRPSRVLIVEDEMLIALHLTQMLEDLGITDVECASNLESAANLIRIAPPDFAILDINIGRALVFPVADELRNRGIPFAFSSPEFARAPFAPKPLEPEALTSILSSLGFGGGAAQHAD